MKRQFVYLASRMRDGKTVLFTSLFNDLELDGNIVHFTDIMHVLAGPYTMEEVCDNAELSAVPFNF